MTPEDPMDPSAGEPRSAADPAPEYGDEERLLIRSAELDVPRESARRQALEAGLAALGERPRHGRVVALAVGSVALAAAAAFAFSVRSTPAPRLEVSAERVPAVAPPAPAPAPPIVSRQPCPSLVVAQGNQPLLDDFEQKDSDLAAFDGRRGSWTNYDDGTGKQNPPDHSALLPAAIPGGRGASKHALRVSGGRFTKWGVTFGSELADAACYDASAYAGFELWARGKGEVRVGVQMIDVQDSKYGGFCKADCFNSHRKVIVLGKKWQKFEFRWEELKQLYAGGENLPLDVRRIRFIEFSVPAESTPFDAWVDDVTFVPKK